MSQQANWRWCNKCQELTFAGGSGPGPCAAGGTHDHTGSGNYQLPDNVSAGPGQQADWQWCNTCQALAFAGGARPGSCSAHNHTGSGNYVLAVDVAPRQGWQADWQWCNKCQTLAFAGGSGPGPCAAGGTHDHTGSGNYQIEWAPTPPQATISVSISGREFTFTGSGWVPGTTVQVTSDFIYATGDISGGPYGPYSVAAGGTFGDTIPVNYFGSAGQLTVEAKDTGSGQSASAYALNLGG